MSTDILLKSRLLTSMVVLIAFVFSAGAIMIYTSVSSDDLMKQSPIEWLNIISANKAIYVPMGILALYSLLMLGVVTRRQKKNVEFEKSLVEREKNLPDKNSSVLQSNPSFSPLIHTKHSDSVPPNSNYAQNLLQKSSDTPDNQFDDNGLSSLRCELKDIEEKLDSANAVKSQFLANMSHELRTPMNGILGMTELLMGSGLNDKQKRFADSVRRSAESLLSIINDLLDYSRMDGGNLLLEKATFNIRELVEDVCDLHAEHAQTKGLELICHVDKTMSEFVSGDSNRIRQLLANLLGNAIKFTREGEIVVRVKQNELAKKATNGEQQFLEYQIDVVDTGVGITPEGQARIFESFTQADDSFAREFGGAGLGLYITHRLITMMGGEIKLRSRMNEGSHFTATMLLDRADQLESDDNKSVSLEGVRVLVVDDNETNRTILFHQLKSWGIISEVAESGSKALELLRNAARSKEPFHIAILDLHMPVMDGLELTREIQQDGTINSVKRMMLTSAVLDLDMAHLEKIGITQYISKPARQAQLFSVLTDLAPEDVVTVSGQNRKYEESYVPLNLHVLLAEDNLINQEVAENMLSNFGCTSEVVSTGAAAISAGEKHKYDIVLMDCQMPVMDGLEATRRLRESNSVNKDTPIIALTANVLDGDRERCIKSGMNGYIGKPVKQDELYGEMVKHVRSIGQSVEADSADTDGTKSQGNVIDILANDHKANTSTPIMSTIAKSDPANFSDSNSQDSVSTDDDSVSNVDTDAVSEQSQSDGIEDHEINEAALDTIRKLQRPGKPDLLAKVVNVYLEKSPELIDSIVTGFVEGDVTKVKEAAHSMKSSSAYIGAEKFSETFKLIEATANNGNLDELKDLVDNLENSFTRIAANLNNCLDKAA